MSTQESRFERSFPAPSPREYQRSAIEHIVEGIEDEDIGIVILNSPTGSGKSITLETSLNMIGGWGFITTPLNNLVDQMDEDEFLSDRLITLKGRNNYECIHPEDEGTRVDKAICQRQSNFECDFKVSCPYYGRKRRAIDHPEVVTNLSYIMAEGLIDVDPENEWTFGDREVLIVDECQNIEDFAMNFISFTISERTVPDEVWEGIEIPGEEYEDDMEYLIMWLEEEVLNKVNSMLEYLKSTSLKTEGETKDFERLRQFSLRVQNFLEDVEENMWVAEHDVDFVKRGKNKEKIVFEPLYIGRFLEELLWARGKTVVLSSATIPGEGWLEEIGVSDRKVKRINVPSTFPVENRPIIMDHAVGKMVSERSDKEDNRKVNAWPMAQKILQIAEHHEGEKGFVHCRSYGIAKLLRDAFHNHGERKWFKDNVMIQDRNNREESLENWINSDIPVFFSVAMDEGVDLKYDKCRWQVLAKTLYPYMTRRMKKRKEIESEQDFWSYYNRRAIIQLQQAYGRGVRAKDDECVFYVLDSSARKLIQMNAEQFNGWFLEAIDDMRIDPSRGM